jgi:hypothetical protein
LQGVTWLRAVGVIALLVLGLAGCGGGDRKAYVKANETLFEQLPRFPGSRVENETTTAYRANESGPVAGYSTRFDLTLPSQATAGDVGLFYRRRLGPQWWLVENLGGLVLNFRKERAFLSVNLESAGAHMMEIAVDHKYYGKRTAATAERSREAIELARRNGVEYVEREGRTFTLLHLPAELSPGRWRDVPVPVRPHRWRADT